MRNIKWEKAYKGPFPKKEALDLVAHFRNIANPDVNGIYDARIRSRKGGKSFDVYIRTITEPSGSEISHDAYQEIARDNTMAALERRRNY